MFNNILNISSHAVRYLDVFFLTAIENNGKLEDFANKCLQPFRCACTWEGRKIVHISIDQHTYDVVSETSWLNLNNISSPESGAVFLILAVACSVIGVVLKLASWLFVSGVLEKNRQLVNLYKEENEKEVIWRQNQPEKVAQNSNPLDSDSKIQSWSGGQKMGPIGSQIYVPTDVLCEVAKCLLGTYNEKRSRENFTDLVHFSRVSKNFNHVAHKTVFEVIKFFHQERKTIEQNFSSFILNCFKQEKAEKVLKQGSEVLSQLPRMRIPAHRVSSDPNDFKIQAYKRATTSGKLSFIQPKDLGAYSVRWGIDPIPFIALKVLYRVEDDRFLLGTVNKVAYRWGLKKDIYLEKMDVISIYKRRQIVVEGLNREGQIKATTWCIYLPWSSKTPNELVDFSLLLEATEGFDSKKREEEQQLLHNLHTLIQTGQGVGLSSQLSGETYLPDGRPVVQLIK